ncbi:MAG: phosphatase PAP2 family protein [Pirellulaceae bacterium]|nr:phosphatase PAP2 family protein [Pirellulaceae bacterium]
MDSATKKWPIETRWETHGEIHWRQTFSIATMLCLASLAVSFYDERICQFFVPDRLPSDLQRLIDLSEVMAHGLTVAVILLLIHRVALPVRPLFWWLVACPLAGGIAANLAKSMVSRIRPHKYWELQAAPEGLAHSFVGWLPILESNYLRESWRQSFPSGHTATAFSLAVALSWAFPRGRVIFYFLAGLAGLQRIVSHSHWPSDVFVGAAIGLLAGTLVKAVAVRQAVRMNALG